MVVRTAKMTGRPTSIAPSTAAFKGGKPSSCLRNIFSPMMMASSTTIPRTIMKAKREIMLMETSKLGKIASPVKKDIGIPSVTQKANRTLRNNPRRTITSVRPMARFLNRSSRRLFSISDMSAKKVISTPAGREGLISSM